jgi:glycosyltransferase involved in cell wall biosynthesis
MRVLIVSSASLSPGDTIHSGFELSQAKHLSRDYQVTILAVRMLDGIVGSGARRIVGRIATRHRKEDVAALGRLAVEIVDHWRRGPRVDVHCIEKVEVVEAVYSRSVFEQSFNAQLRVWLNAALAAFGKYVEINGKPDLVHAHGRFLHGGALALELKRRFGVPYVYTEHSSFYHRAIAPPEAKPVLQNIIESAGEYSVVSPFLESTVARYLGPPLRNAVPLPNVLDDYYESEPMRMPPATGPFVFMTIATLYDHKGVDFVMKAFAEAFHGQESYVLRLCGDGPEMPALKDLVRELGLTGQVEFLGRLSKQDVLRHIDASHALVLGSRIETFGVVLIEALARGRPVIGTRCGGPDTIVESDFGLLVDVDDVPQMAAALRQMTINIQNYDGDAIRRHALRIYGAQAFRDTIASIYQTALQKAA